MAAGFGEKREQGVGGARPKATSTTPLKLPRRLILVPFLSLAYPSAFRGAIIYFCFFMTELGKTPNCLMIYSSVREGSFLMLF
jgi:hypothetical protein